MKNVMLAAVFLLAALSASAQDVYPPEGATSGYGNRVLWWDFTGTTGTHFGSGAIGGGNQTQPDGTVVNPGIIQIGNNSNANGGVYWQVGGLSFLIGGGESFLLLFRVDAATDVVGHFGFQDAFTAAEPVDGVYLNLDGTTLDGMTASNSTRSTTTSSYTVSTATWYTGRVSVNATATEVTFTLYDSTNVLLWSDSLTTNIPTAAGRTTGAGATAYKTTIADADFLSYDYMEATTPTLAARGAGAGAGVNFAGGLTWPLLAPESTDAAPAYAYSADHDMGCHRGLAAVWGYDSLICSNEDASDFSGSYLQLSTNGVARFLALSSSDAAGNGGTYFANSPGGATPWGSATITAADYTVGAGAVARVSLTGTTAGVGDIEVLAQSDTLSSTTTFGDSDTTFTDPILGPNGSLSATAYSFSDAPSSGIYATTSDDGGNVTLKGGDQTGTDLVGGRISLNLGKGTGNGRGGNFALNLPAPTDGTSGAVQNAYQTALYVDGLRGYFNLGGVDTYSVLGASPSRIAASDQANTVTDGVGADLILRGGFGTGTGDPGDILFETSTALGTGSTQQTATTRLTIAEEDITSTVPIFAPNGEQIAPSIGFDNYNDSGLYITDNDDGGNLGLVAHSPAGTDQRGGRLNLLAGRGTGNARGGNFSISLAVPQTLVSGSAYSTWNGWLYVDGDQGYFTMGGLDTVNNPTTSTIAAADRINATDGTGGRLDIRAGFGTGAGTPGRIQLQTGTTLVSGTTQQTATTRMTIDENAITATVPIEAPNVANVGLPIMKVAEVTIPQASVATLFTVPYTIVAGVSGSVVYPEHLYVEKPSGTAWTTTGSGVLRVSWSGDTFANPFVMTSQTVVDNFFGSTAAQTWIAMVGKHQQGYQFPGTHNFGNTALVLYLQTADISGGTGDLTVKVWYREWVLP